MNTLNKQKLINKSLCSVVFTFVVLISNATDAKPFKADFNGDGYQDMVVGAPLEDVNGKNAAGAISVFYGNASGLPTQSQQQFNQDFQGEGDQTQIVDQAEADDQFGSVLAVGDFDGNGYDDVAVGIPNEDIWDQFAPDNRIKKVGGVAVIYGSAIGLQTWGNHLLRFKELSEYQHRENDRFGEALSTGDYNGDGYDDLAVSIPNFDYKDVQNAGMVLVIFGSSGGLPTSRSLFRGAVLGQWQSRVPGIHETGDRLGNALATHDFDGDGFDDLAIGIPLEDITDITNAGAVAVIYGSGNNFGFDSNRSVLFTDRFNGLTEERGDSFGGALTAGDFNGDGYPDLAIGHPFEDASAVDAGAVTVIYSSSTGLQSLRRQYWPADVFNLPGKPEKSDRFGTTLAAADFTDDGIDDLAIGTPYEDQERRFRSDRKNAGRVTVLYGSRRGIGVGKHSDWHEDTSGVFGSRSSHDWFGTAIGVGDFNHDQIFDLAVGVPGEDVENGTGKAKDAGMVHIFYGTTQGLSTDPILGPETFSQGWGISNPDRAGEGDKFGSALP